MKARALLVMGVLLPVGLPAWSAERQARPRSPALAADVAEPSANVRDTVGQPPEAQAEPAAVIDESAAPIIDDDSAPPAAGAPTPPALAKMAGAGEDLKLKKEIQTVFRKDPDLRNNRIAVTVDNCNTDAISTNCNVTLAGAVDSQAERVKAEQVARVKGVVLILNQLDLGGDATDGIPDGAVTGKVRELLLADATFKSSIISISTTHGVVTLVGTVPSDSLRRQAGEKARLARAVKRVDNALRVEPERQAERRPPAVVSK